MIVGFSEFSICVLRLRLNFYRLRIKKGSIVVSGGVLCLCVLWRRRIFVRLTRFRDENIYLCGLFFGSGDIFFRFLHISSYGLGYLRPCFARFLGNKTDRYASAPVYMSIVLLMIICFLRHCSIRRFCGYFEAVFFDERRHFGRIFRRFASMRRLSRLARARISRVPDVGFGGRRFRLRFVPKISNFS